MPHNLISAQESPVPLTKFQNLNIFWVKERNPDILSCFSQKLPARDSPPGSPVERLGREIPACGAFLHLSKYISYCLSLRVPGKEAPSMFPNRVPTDRDTPSPEPLAKRRDSIYLFIYLFIHSFIHSCMSA